MSENSYLPVTLALDHHTGRFEKATGTVPADHFLYRTSRAPYLLTVLTVQ